MEEKQLQEKDSLILILDDESHTEALGMILAQSLTTPRSLPVPALYLQGDLGTGKTTFTRALVQALPGGNEAEVASPSFTLCNEYATQPPILHADIYRLGPQTTLPEEMEDALEAGNLLLLEWADYLKNVDAILPRLEIHFALFKPQAPDSLDINEQACERKRLVTLTALGKAGVALLHSMRPCLLTRFQIC